VVYGKLVIEPEIDLKALRAELETLLKRSPSVQLVVPELLEAIGDTVAAGKAHQLWRGLEKHS
jgi:hypothetical protein